MAKGPIDVVVYVLVAGYVVSLSSQVKPVVAIFQASHADTSENLARIEKKIDYLNRLEDPTVTKTHTTLAEARLSIILKCRSFSTGKSRENIRALLREITEGELRYVEKNLRAQILYWAARLHASSRETLHIAEERVRELKDNWPEFDCRIPDALILETKGEQDKALRLAAQINDPDGRATAFGLLSRARGRSTALEWFQEHDGTEAWDFLSGLGWFNVAVSLCESDCWQDAATLIARLAPLWEEWPDLAYLDGVINAAMLLPEELRVHALKMNLFHSVMRPRFGITEAKTRARALSSFGRAANLLDGLGEDGKLRAQGARQWILWLRLTDPDPTIVNHARSEVSEAMRNAKRAIDLLPFAECFGIEFDPEPLRRYLSRRSKLDALEPPEVFAELTLAEIGMTKGEFAEFLEREQERLCRIIPRVVIVGKQIEALVAVEQAGKADALLHENETIFVDRDFERFRALIAAKKGEDPRVELEKLYSETHSLLDLKNLILHLGRMRDWPALQPLLESLFRIDRNPANAMQLIQCYKNLPNGGARGILAFFGHEPDVETWSEDLASEHAWALFEIGRLGEAKKILGGLISRRGNVNDTHLDINIAIKSGDWERLPAIVEREWDQRENLPAFLLIRLATVAAEADKNPVRALELARIATKKAPDNPEILISAFLLAVQLGREEDVDPAWVSRAVELSTKSGPIYKVNIKAVIEEMVPANRKLAADISAKLLEGVIPLSFAASRWGLPLSRILIDIPRRNEDLRDGRQRVIIPVFSGARQPQQITHDAVVGMDITTILLLGWLDILEKAISSVNHTLIPSSTMIHLLNERRRVKFHQPSVVRRAERVTDLITQGRLTLAVELPTPPEWLVREVGIELAQLIERARKQNSTVVYAGKIHKVGSYMEEEAQLKEYAPFVLSLHAFLQRMLEEGQIADEVFERGAAALKAAESSTSCAISAPNHLASFFLDDLALTYLGNAGILESITRSALTLYVHPSIRDDQQALLLANREEEWLADKLEHIRTTLKDLLDRGRISFLPGNFSRENDLDSTDTLTELCQNARDCDVVCIDERFANRFPSVSDKDGTSRPLVCTLDLLRYFVSAGHISESKRFELEHRMRGGGFALVNVDKADLHRMLRTAKIDASGDLVEPAELRNLRQYLARVRVLEMVQEPVEVSFLDQLRRTSVEAIRELWEDQSLENAHASAVSEWVLRYIYPNPVDWLPSLRDAAQAEQTNIAIASHLKLLVSPLVNATFERSRLFAAWLDREIVAALRPSNSEVMQLIVGLCKSQIEQLESRFGKDGNHEHA